MQEPEIACSIDIAAPREAVYAAWADVARWSEWDPDTRAAWLDGPPIAGARGWLQPRRGLRVRMRVVQAEPARAFTVVCPVLGSCMRFEHLLTDAAGGVRATHRVTFSGWLAGWLMRTVGRDVRQGLPHTLERLKHRLEQGSGTPG